jgi:hypothetical protein
MTHGRLHDKVHHREAVAHRARLGIEDLSKGETSPTGLEVLLIAAPQQACIDRARIPFPRQSQLMR